MLVGQPPAPQHVDATETGPSFVALPSREMRYVPLGYVPSLKSPLGAYAVQTVFDPAICFQNIPLADNPWGFEIMLVLQLALGIGLVWLLRKKGLF